jgi:hypothetical protein
VNTNTSTPPRILRQGRRWLAAGLGTALLASSLALSGCASGASGSGGPASSASPADVILSSHGLAGRDAAGVIDALEAQDVNDRPTGLTASVRPDELMLADGAGHQASLPIPEDRFYLSVAPYVSQTHECHYHSLTTCTGELGDTDVRIRVTDDATGEALVDGTMTTADNGFIGLWLPRGIRATLSVEADGGTATAAVSTSGDEAATCLTTLQLS